MSDHLDELERLTDGVEDALLEVTVDPPRPDVAATILHDLLNPRTKPESRVRHER